MNGNNRNLNNNNRVREWLLSEVFIKMAGDIYNKIVSLRNITLAWRKARKGKTKRKDIRKFEENLAYNLRVLHDELKNQSYNPEPLKTFILRDPKTRKISKSTFRDRIVHHALCNIIEPIFDKIFFYDSCASRRGKGTLSAIMRFKKFQMKVTNNLSKESFCLKADIKHYFYEINRDILLNIIRKKINCEKTLDLVKLIIDNFEEKKGMPLGNLTSQFFANVYLNELDYFVKHKLRAKYYLRYVDDFIILHKSRYQLEIWKEEINKFLKSELRIKLHEEKTRIINLSNGVDFVGFRNFYYYKLLRKRSINKMKLRINEFKEKNISKKKFKEILQGWMAYAKWANNNHLIKKTIKSIN